MRILFITSSRIGDAVLSSALLAYLVNRHPGARFTICCGPAPAPLFEAVPGLERIIAMPKRRMGAHWLSLWMRVAAARWDMVVDLRASIFAWTILAKDRRVFRYNHALGHRLRQQSAIFGLQNEPPAPTLWVLPRHDAEAARLIPAGMPVLALGPTANWARKIWPPDRFVELARRLTSATGLFPGAKVAVFGSPSERAAALPVIEGLAGGAIDVVGRVDLLTVYACLRRCSLYVGNDSGLMHMAAAAGIPTLGLFGPSKDSLYAPWGINSAVVRTPEAYEDLVAGPAYSRFARVSLMSSLGVDAVEHAARELWRRTRRP